MNERGLDTRAAVPNRVARRTLDRWFHWAMALLIGACVVYGFSHTIDDNLFHATVPRPWILWVHAAMFFTWVALFFAQTSLIATRQVQWHRRLGAFGVVLGTCIPLVGIATSFAMTRFDIANGTFTEADALSFLSVPFNDMLVFVSAFGLAILWRKWPDFHRRLMFIATCSLTAAAFARFPFITITEIKWYGGVDLLLLAGGLRDLIATGRVHKVYRIAVPAIVVGQLLAMALFLGQSSWWVGMMRRLVY